MSADRYTTCPRCVYEYITTLDDLRTEIALKYPDLSPEAQSVLLPVLTNERGIRVTDRTFRENYEFAHGDDDPTVQVVYSGGCSVCGLTLKIDETHVIWTRP